jgi:hypothetical protein
LFQTGVHRNNRLNKNRNNGPLAMDTKLRPVCLALYDVSCVALDASRKVEGYRAGEIDEATVYRVLERLVVLQDQIAAVMDLMDSAAVGGPF